MKAVVYRRYGGPDVLRLEDVRKPFPRANEVLVRVRASTVTAADWRLRIPDPFAGRLFNGLFRPTRVKILGFELSGVVEAAGKKVTRFREGDEVFGNNGFRYGGYAEYVCVPENGLIATRPESMPLDEAAALTFGGLAALNLLRKANIQRGQKVLIYAASGSTGTYAVQIARSFSTQVDAVCGPSNLEMVKSLGAEQVFDYTSEDITTRPERYDLIFDAVGVMFSGHSKSDFQPLLTPDGTFISVEDSRKDRREDLDYLKMLVEDGQLKAVIDRRYPLEQTAEAHRYVEGRHKKGHVLITVGGSEDAAS